MAEYLGRLLHRIEPQRGWPPFLLLLVALLCVPGALLLGAEQRHAGRVFTALAPSVPVLVVLIGLAVPLGLGLSRTRLGARWAGMLGSASGVGLVFSIIGRLVPPPSLWATWMNDLALWLRLRSLGVMGLHLVPLSIARLITRRAVDFGAGILWEARAVAGGASFWDTSMYALLAASLLWASAFFAAWQLYRKHSALVALLPCGVILGFLAFRHPATTFYLLIFLFSLLWLVATSQLWTHSDRWDSTGADYPDGMGLELAFSLAPSILALLLIAAFIPNWGFWSLSRSIWDRAEGVFGPFYATQRGDADSEGGLPQAHLLGGSPDLADIPVLYVTTNDPPPVLPGPETAGSEIAGARAIATPRRYWRGDTFDIYTGLGWSSSHLEARAVSAGDPLDPSPSGTSDRFALTQQFERASPGDWLLYAANAPAQIADSALGWWRGPGDLARLTSDADTYRVISHPPEPTITALRTASTYIPAEMAERYLALPESVPERVLDLAHLVVESVDTDYDRARAIEAYLRTYTYTLEIPSPPTEHDLVDYFLFDLQQGYCDYYASAMVVMARAVGLPARFATGYAQGEYDPVEQRWIVTEFHGHSWVEVYFDGLGWIEFEPTAGQPGLVRAGGDDQLLPAIPPLPARSVDWWVRLPWGLVAVGAIFLLLCAIVFGIWWSAGRSDRSATDLVSNRYARLLCWGARLGQPARDGQTVHEYCSLLGRTVQQRALGSRWDSTRRAATEAMESIEQLADVYHRSQYGCQRLPDRDGWRIRELWSRLRANLCRLWLARVKQP